VDQHRVRNGFLTALPLIFAAQTAVAGEPPASAPLTAGQREVLALMAPRNLTDFNLVSRAADCEEVIVTAAHPESPQKKSILSARFEKPDFKQQIFEYVTGHIGLTKLQLDKTAISYQMYHVSERSRYEWLRGGRLQLFVGEGMGEKTKPPQGMERLFKDEHSHEITYGLQFTRGL
jgi:hypothetical protein